jgi:hypothetical protein
MIVTNMRDRRYHAALVLLTELNSLESTLSKANQFRLLECLYRTKKYRSVIEKSREYAESGTSANDIIFLRALCHYQLGQFSRAREIFCRYPEWARWEKKAAIKADSSAKVITIGEVPPKIDPDKFDATFTESPELISITVPLPGLDPHDLKFSIGESWIDVTCDDPTKRISKSWDLFGKVLPASAKYTVGPESISVELRKKGEGIWGRLTYEDPTEVAFESKLTDFLSQLHPDRELSDESASEQFEQSVNLSRETGVDISSWFRDF